MLLIMLLCATSKRVKTTFVTLCHTFITIPFFKRDVINVWPLRIKKRKSRMKKSPIQFIALFFRSTLEEAILRGFLSQKGVFLLREGGCVRKDRVLQDVGNHPPCLRCDVYYCTKHLCWTASNATAFNWLYLYWPDVWIFCLYFRVPHEDFRRRRRRLLWSWGIKKANSPKQNWKITRQVVLHFILFILEIVLFCMFPLFCAKWCIFLFSHVCIMIMKVNHGHQERATSSLPPPPKNFVNDEIKKRKLFYYYYFNTNGSVNKSYE